MIKFVALLACVCACYALPAEVPAGHKPHEVVPIVSEESAVEPDGSFTYSFEAGNGIKVHEEGVPKPVEKGEIAETVSGSYEYPSPDGKTVKVTYTADETGFHPQGDSIPQIPEPIAKALRYLAEHPQQQELGEKVH